MPIRQRGYPFKNRYDGYKKHLEILKKGVWYWNNWRQTHPEEKVVLAAAEITGENLEGINFQQVYLIAVDFEDTNLRNANFLGANLSHANLSGTNLENANFESANLEKAIFQGANIQGASFLETHLDNSIGLKQDLLESVVEINITDSDVNITDIRQVEAASKSLMTALGYTPGSKGDEEYGSFFGRIRFRIARMISPEVKSRLYEESRDLINQGKESVYSRLGHVGVESTNQMAEATSQLLTSLENIDNAVIRLGKLVVIKLTDEKGKSRIIAETVSLKLQNKMESNPKFLRDPNAVAAFLEEEKRNETIEIAS